MELRRKYESGNWLPISVDKLDEFLASALKGDPSYPNAAGLRRNLAYNLQYLEYMEQTLNDLKLTSVLLTQTWKAVIIVGCGVVECLLHYFLITTMNHSETDWRLEFVANGSPKAINGTDVRIDSHVYKRLKEPMLKTMTFDAMLKRAEKKKVMGNNHNVYAKLNLLRSLRNRVHLQEMGSPRDTDWNAFNNKDHKIMMQVLYSIFTSAPFSPTHNQIVYFGYMLPHVAP